MRGGTFKRDGLSIFSQAMNFSQKMIVPIQNEGLKEPLEKMKQNTAACVWSDKN